MLKSLTKSHGTTMSRKKSSHKKSLPLESFTSSNSSLTSERLSTDTLDELESKVDFDEKNVHYLKKQKNVGTFNVMQIADLIE